VVVNEDEDDRDDANSERHTDQKNDELRVCESFTTVAVRVRIPATLIVLNGWYRHAHRALAVREIERLAKEMIGIAPVFVTFAHFVPLVDVLTTLVHRFGKIIAGTVLIYCSSANIVLFEAYKAPFAFAERAPALLVRTVALHRFSTRNEFVD